MQCIFYASLGFFLFFFGYLLNETILLDHFFSYQEIALTTKLGLVTTISFLLTAIISALFLVLVVERAKKMFGLFSDSSYFSFTWVYFLWRFSYALVVVAITGGIATHHDGFGRVYVLAA